MVIWIDIFITGSHLIIILNLHVINIYLTFDVHQQVTLVDDAISLMSLICSLELGFVDEI